MAGGYHAGQRSPKGIPVAPDASQSLTLSDYIITVHFMICIIPQTGSLREQGLQSQWQACFLDFSSVLDMDILGLQWTFGIEAREGSDTHI